MATKALDLESSDFVELVNYLETTSECDTTLKHTRAWLRSHGFAVGEATEELGKHGGYCDCEVLLNVAPLFIDVEDEEPE